MLGDVAELRGGEGLPVTVWLIERQGFIGPIYLALGDHGVEWTSDHAAAQRYPTEQAGKDAWLAALDLDPSLEKFERSDRPVRVTEHQWG